MTRLSTLPSHREQAHHALVLLGVPAPARLVADVHGALFDGDLSVPALAALLRDEQRRAAGGAAVEFEPAGAGDDAAGWEPANAEGDAVQWEPANAEDDAVEWEPGNAGGDAVEWESAGAGGDAAGWESAGAGGDAVEWESAGAGGDAVEWESAGARGEAAASRGVASDPSARPDAPAAAVPTPAAGGHGGTGGRPYLICPGLHLDLTAARGHLTLSTWPVADRLCTPAAGRAAALVATVRIAEFAAMRPGRCATRLLRQLAEAVPGGPEAVDVLRPGSLAEAARAALADPALAAAVAAEAPLREAAARRAEALDAAQRLFGSTGLPHQRGGA